MTSAPTDAAPPDAAPPANEPAAPTEAELVVHDTGPFQLADGSAAAKASKLYVPSGAAGPLAGVVCVHGSCTETWKAGVAMGDGAIDPLEHEPEARGGLQGLSTSQPSFNLWRE